MTQPEGTTHDDTAAGSTGVELASGSSATAHLHRVLRSAADAFPDAFAAVELPTDSAGFKKDFPELLPEFEAARLGSDRRTEIAETMLAAARAAMVVNPGEVPLTDAVAAPADPFAVTTAVLPGTPGLVPEVPIDAQRLDGLHLLDAVHALVDRGSAARPVADAVTWLVDRAGADGIDLSGRRIVMFGAGAELAPTRLWLAGGAEVLWIDVAEPSAELLADEQLAGTLHWVPGGADLLAEPGRVRATIEQFANGEQVDVGLYAYAPGRAREWRLTATMNAIVDCLGADTVRSVAMLVSPTTCGALSADELDAEQRRRDGRPRWQSALAAAHLLGSGAGHAGDGPSAVNRGIVGIQGTSYQAAQYVGKLLAAEVWAIRRPAFAVSANTAGVSLTESLHHPVFDVAFAGAASFDIETFAPATTAALNGLLTLHDRLDPAVAERPLSELFATRVHGGIYCLPYPIDPALRVAAAIGAAKDPRRLVKLVRRGAA